MEAQLAAGIGDSVDLRGATGVQVGDNAHMHLYVGSGRPPWWTRSGYIEQVRSIAPGGGLSGALRDRDAELADLGAFCTGDAGYLWWKAEPWAGKSALLSTFVLNPPPQVEVVSFFITAGLATQSDSTAFTDMMIDQLSAIVGESASCSLTPAVRDAHRRALLRAATDKVRAEGRRLVLVVDGLDEDRGARAGSGLPSVASLLPKVCGDGLRVVVASRPNPLLPDDVPADHPLRRGCQVRDLGVSPHATEVATRASRELQDLLHGDQLHQDILGLITACGGGLTLTELEELSGVPPYRLEGLLGGVFGRTVAGRADHTGTDSGRLYLFTHETLRETATRHLGRVLADYRDRLHAWADRYRLPTDSRAAWPENTPQYLLRGYVRMLTDLADTDRLVELAADSVRHDLMLSLSGGDAGAFAEIHTCQDLLLARTEFTESVLFDLARLSHHRNRLEARNSAIPTALPGVWATIGQPARAEALALGFIHPYMRARALAEVVRGLGRVDDHDRAEQIANSINDPGERARGLASLVWNLASAGEHGHAERIARTITVLKVQNRALARVAQALAGAGENDGAERIVCSIADPQMRARAQAQESIELTWDAWDPGEEDWRLKDSICEWDDLGEHNWVSNARECEVVDMHEGAWAECVACSIDDPDEQAKTLDDMTQSWAGAGKHARAERLALGITLPKERAWSLTRLAQTLAGVGELERARRLAEAAEHVARNIVDPDEQASSLIRFARSLVEVGELERARRVAEAAERVARDIRNVDGRMWALLDVFRFFVRVIDHDRAERIARDIIVDPTLNDVHEWVLTDLVQVFAKAGELGRALRLAEDAEQMAPDLIDLDEIARILARLAKHTSEPEPAQRSAENAERIARGSGDPGERAWSQIRLAHVLAEAGESDRVRHLAKDAERLAQSIPDLNERASALTELAAAVGLAGAGRLLGAALAIGPWHGPLVVLARLYPRVVVQIADMVFEDAEVGGVQLT